MYPTILFEGVAGSRLYGTHRPDSDRDVRGVALAPLGSLIGLDSPFEQLEQREPIDRVLWELRKFLHLAAANNPNILDVLFTPPSAWLGGMEEWKSIYALRRDVLSKKVRKSYVGYANGQLGRIEGHMKWLKTPPSQPDEHQYGRYEGSTWVWNSQAAQKAYKALHKEWTGYQTWLAGRNPERHALEVQFGYDTKHAGHIWRLVLQSAQILRDGDFSPVLAGEDLESVRQVMAGALTYEELVQEAKARFTAIDQMASALPDEPRMDQLNDTCQAIYADHIARGRLENRLVFPPSVGR